MHFAAGDMRSRNTHIGGRYGIIADRTPWRPKDNDPSIRRILDGIVFDQRIGTR